MSKFFIIGTGPGHKDYLMPAALRQIKRSDCLIGARRLLSLFTNLRKQEIPVEKCFDKIIPYIKRHKDKKKIAVLVSGDPGIFSLSEIISREFRKDEYVVIPGISSLQLAFARIGEGWQDAKIISLHGRCPEDLAGQVKNNHKVFILTDPYFTPRKISGHLLKKGVENRKAIVLENLSYPNERIINTDLNGLSKMDGFGICVMIIKG